MEERYNKLVAKNDAAYKSLRPEERDVVDRLRAAHENENENEKSKLEAATKKSHADDDEVRQQQDAWLSRGNLDLWRMECKRSLWINMARLPSPNLGK
jgi:hypothetical protein